ncbi:Rep-C [Ecklonia radiata-associated virus 3]|uniref:Rep-C n=1 Tax=Ecklonia radiata-associated virus 3 TaxID=2480193 RepID=UPI000F6A2EF9|nr:Rep-C [Ecklonia radiata-associated virus 3]AYM54668.1 Rep-C [Ecklonia radiata-associated virus 3]
MAATAPSRQSRHRRWCFTLNSPVFSLNYYSILENVSKRFVFGLERAPTTGRQHLQGYLEFANPSGFGRVSKLLPAHWEPARGSWKQNYDYCVKEGSYQSYGDWNSGVCDVSRSGVSNGKLSVSSIVRRLVYHQAEDVYLSWDYIRNKKSIDELVYKFGQAKLRHERYQQFYHSFLSDWQQECILHLSEQGPRRVCWYYDVTGGTGKSFLANILFSCYNYELFDGITSSRDITLMLSDSFSGVCIDVTRDDNKLFSYSTLEKLKNGFIMTGKYQGYKRLFAVKPVIVFANFEPDTTKLSSDRWCVHSLDYVSQEAKNPLPPTPFAPPAFSEEDPEA